MMRIPGDPRFRPNTLLSAGELQRVADQAARTEKMSVTGGAAADLGDGGLAIAVESEAEWWIRITAKTSSSPPGFYSWETVRRTTGGSDWEAYDQGPAGSDDTSAPAGFLPAIEIMKNEGVPTNGTAVRRAWIGEDGASVHFDWPVGAPTGDHPTTFYGPVTFNGPTHYNVFSTTPIGAGDTNNLTLIGGSVGFLDVTVDGSRLTGIVAPTLPAGPMRILYCNTGNATLTIANEDLASADINRILTPYSTQADVLLPPNFWIELQYDTDLHRWRVMFVTDNLLKGAFDDGPFATNLHDYDIDDRWPVQVWEPTANIWLTGLANGKKGQWFYISNGYSDKSITIKHLHVGSAVGNRFVTPGHVDYVVPKGGGVLITYDGLYWRIIACNLVPAVDAIIDLDKVIAVPDAPQVFAFLNAPLTTPRTVTLPPASSVPPGTSVVIVDKSGYLGPVNYLSIMRDGSDTINGVTSENLTTPYSKMDYVSDGVSKWTRAATPAGGGTPTLNQYQIGIGDATNLLSGSSTFTHQSDVTTITSQSGTGQIGKLITRRSNDTTMTTASGYRGIRSGGTIASPTDTTAGMYINSFIAAARSSSVESDRARIDAVAASATEVDLYFRTYFGGAWNDIMKMSGVNGSINLPLLTASRILSLDGSKNIVSSIDAATLATLASPALTGVPTAPTAAGGTSTTQIATTAFVVNEVASVVAAADAMVFKGVIDCSANPNYPAADRGWTYRVSVAGKTGGASGPNVEAGDLLLCLTDATPAGNHATVGADWTIAQTNLDGAVIGPATATDGGLARFDGTSGKLLKATSATITTTDIDNAAVTLAKQADMATASVVYRKTVGSGAPEVNTLATLKTDLGLTGTNSGDQVIPDDARLAGDNYLHNGAGDIWQRQNAPGTLTAYSDDTYGPDRWYVLTQTASVQLQRSTGDAAQYSILLKQNQASAQRMGLAQIIEAADTIPLRGKDVVFQDRIRCSASQAIRVVVAEWTGAADAPISDIVNDWTSSTYTTSNFFISTTTTVTAVAATTPGAATWADISVTGTVSASANNLIVFVWTEGTAAQNVTLEITQAALYAGTATRTWYRRPLAEELYACQRFCFVLDDATVSGRYIGGRVDTTSVAFFCWPLPREMRAAPTLTMTNAANINVNDGAVNIAASSLSASFATSRSLACNITTAVSTLTVGRNVFISFGNANALILATSDL